MVSSMARGRIPDSDIAAIRERTPIEEIVASTFSSSPVVRTPSKGSHRLKTSALLRFTCVPIMAITTAFPQEREGMSSAS